MEGIGHTASYRIPEYCSIFREKTYIPFMPLGPIVSDHTYGQDHITSSVGATYLASHGGADIINSVTREEHAGGIPTVQSILEAIDAASTVVQIVNESRFPSYFSKVTSTITIVWAHSLMSDAPDVMMNALLSGTRRTESSMSASTFRRTLYSPNKGDSSTLESKNSLDNTT